MKRLIIAASVLLISTVTFANTLQSLNQAQVNEQLKGKTISTIPLVTINGALVNNTFTGFLDSNGNMDGHMANKPENDPISDTGTWTVSQNGTLCVTWQHWNNTKPICVSVYKVNNGLLFINEKSHALETIVLSDSIKNGKQVS